MMRKPQSPSGRSASASLQRNMGDGSEEQHCRLVLLGPDRPTAARVPSASRLGSGGGQHRPTSSVRQTRSLTCGFGTSRR